MPDTFLPFVTGGSGSYRPELGVCMNEPYKIPGPAQERALSLLGPERHHNWGSWPDILPDEAYTPVIWSPAYQLAAEQYKNLARRNPGRIWLLLNEPDYPRQANVQPEAAVSFLRTWIRELTPLCDVALPGVSVSYHDGRKALNWLDSYLDAGGPIAHYWHIHIYAPSVETWNHQLQIWLEWWSSKGAGKPTIISETSLYPTASEAEQIDLMETIAGIGDPRIHAVYWYAAASNSWTPGLLDTAGELNRLGQAWVALSSST